jgi:hypothetical protein
MKPDWSMSPVRLVILPFLCFLTIVNDLQGQGETHLYLFNLAKSADDAYHVYGPKYLSAFNRKGYTNQPFFTPTGDLLVSVRKARESQNDIWLLSLSSKKCKRLTQTKANEYSPQVQPGGGKYSVLRQLDDEPIDQQVMSFSTTGGKTISLTPDVNDIGYYAWLNPEELVLYRIDGESNRLSSYSIRDQKSRRITTAIGRTLISDGKGSVYYVHKFSAEYWYLKKYSQSSAVVDVLAETPAKSEDFAMAPDGTFFMGKDQKLMFLSSKDPDTWKVCMDLSLYGIQHITRMAISPDGRLLALVATKE